MAELPIRTYELRGSFQADAETAKRVKEMVELIVSLFLVPVNEETADG